MHSSEIRRVFLKFFEERGHTVCSSDSLIPSKDPTLLFTTAGMVQFKALYAGAPLSFSKAATVQKCLRAGGKGSDLENVGITLRHHTFFEMLGNFSFGDYFKKEAIEWAWEFLIDVMKLDKKRIWVSVFHQDDEAEQIWTTLIKFPKEKIVKLGEKDNFWGPAGTTGACGPCSEIYYDLGPEYGCGQASCKPGCDCQRYLEVWNLVFPQFFQEEDGSRSQLQRRGIDTGMGLERLSFIAQGKANNYHSDLFWPLIEEVQKITDLQYKKENASSFHVIVDHARALTFALADGVAPSNEGRGYVMRRILRRAIRFAKKINFNQPILHLLVPKIVQEYSVYTNLAERRDKIIAMIHSEEEKCFSTLSSGMDILEELIASYQSQGKKEISGKEIFRLYDTLGFPKDVVDEVLSELGMSFNKKDFEDCMQVQKKRAKADWDSKTRSADINVYTQILAQNGKTKFLGYETLNSKSKVIALIQNGKSVAKAEPGLVEIILDQAPFYGESGGQVGDQGIIAKDDQSIQILTTRVPFDGINGHVAELKTGQTLCVNDVVNCAVDQVLRANTMRHHSGTHLLHASLRKILGAHVEQAGSLVNAERLRFDFSHGGAISPAELKAIETLVNQQVEQNVPVNMQEMPLDKAKQKGALAFFGDKYGDIVRVVSMGVFSTELCGGTHVKETKEIGLMKIVSEEGISAGVRRIEAVCGPRAVEYLSRDFEITQQLTQTLKVTKDEILSRIEQLLEDRKNLEKEITKLKEKQALNLIDSILAKGTDQNGFKVCIENLAEFDGTLLKTLIENLQKKVSQGVILLACHNEGKVFFQMWASDQAVKKGIHAGQIVQELAKLTGGGGGGKPNMAQAGGKDITKISEALSVAQEKIIKLLI